MSNRPGDPGRRNHPESEVDAFSLNRRLLLQSLAAAALPLGALSCSGKKGAENSLIVGGLPVTCNLTLPVACTANAAQAAAGGATAKPGSQFVFEYNKYS